MATQPILVPVTSPSIAVEILQLYGLGSTALGKKIQRQLLELVIERGAGENIRYLLVLNQTTAPRRQLGNPVLRRIAAVAAERLGRWEALAVLVELPQYLDIERMKIWERIVHGTPLRTLLTTYADELKRLAFLEDEAELLIEKIGRSPERQELAELLLEIINANPVPPGAQSENTSRVTLEQKERLEDMMSTKSATLQPLRLVVDRDKK